LSTLPEGYTDLSKRGASIEETIEYDHSALCNALMPQEVAHCLRNIAVLIGSLLSPVENIVFSFDTQAFSSLS